MVQVPPVCVMKAGLAPRRYPSERFSQEHALCRSIRRTRRTRRRHMLLIGNTAYRTLDRSVVHAIVTAGI